MANLFGVSTAKETLLHAFQVESMGKEGGREGGRGGRERKGREGKKREGRERRKKQAMLMYCYFA